ncbi:MAG: SLC13 family permease [Oscillospiraceae bacterium]
MAAAAGVILGAAVPFMPIVGLSMSAKLALGSLLMAIIWWIFAVLPDYVTALVLGVLFVSLAKVPTPTVFAAFSGSTWWLLMSAFGLSLGITKSGLMKRVTLRLLMLFPGGFRGQTLALLMLGLVVGPFVPSMSAKAAMLAPLSLGISDSLAYERKGKEANGLFLAMLTGIRNPGPLFISASVLGYALLGQYPEAVRSEFTMGRWFLCALPLFLCISILNYLAIVRLYAPKCREHSEKADLSAQLSALGPMSGKEKYMSFIMAGTMLLWITESVHGIPAHIVCISALCLTLAGNVFDRRTFRSDVTWDSIIFIGVALGIAPVFGYLGINDWVVGVCSPIFAWMATNPYLLVFGVGVLTIVLRFVIVSEMTFVNIFMVLAVPIAVELGINPWVVGMAVYALVTPWFFMYQNPVYMAAFYATDGAMADQRTTTRYCLVYVLICLTALLISVPFWIKIGVFFL